MELYCCETVKLLLILKFNHYNNMQEKKKLYVKPISWALALLEPVMVVVGSNHVDPGSSEAKPRPFFPEVEEDDLVFKPENWTGKDGKKPQSVWDD